MALLTIAVVLPKNDVVILPSRVVKPVMEQVRRNVMCVKVAQHVSVMVTLLMEYVEVKVVKLSMTSTIVEIVSRVVLQDYVAWAQSITLSMPQVVIPGRGHVREHLVVVM